MPTRFMFNIFEEEEVCVSILYRISTLKYQKFKCFFHLSYIVNAVSADGQGMFH